MGNYLGPYITLFHSYYIARVLCLKFLLESFYHAYVGKSKLFGQYRCAFAMRTFEEAHLAY